MSAAVAQPTAAPLDMRQGALNDDQPGRCERSPVQHPSCPSRRAIAALGALLLMQGAVQAQTVRVFDEAPSIAQLRSIMVPESRGGQSRSIILFHPDAMPRSDDADGARVPQRQHGHGFRAFSTERYMESPIYTR
jgi:hypothetical protein